MSTNPTPYCVIGFGIAGQLLVLELLKANIPPASITILDQTFSGGDLALTYSCVLSNTPWWKTRKALEAYGSVAEEAIAEGDTLYPKDSCMPVRDIARLCRKAAWKAAAGCIKLKTTVTHLDYRLDWTIQHTSGTLTASKVFLATGGTPKELDLPIPTIPLNVALTPSLLLDTVKLTDRVVVFGTSHSGTLILDTLNKGSIPTIAIYHGETPFQFEADGQYSGLKEHSEQVAKAILKGEHSELSLIPWSDPIAIHKALSSATHVVYAIGFQARTLKQFDAYSPETAQVGDYPRLYGFGLAYPGCTEKDGKRYVDVSVLSFQEQLQRCLPAALL